MIRKPRFRLFTLFLLTAVVAIFFAVRPAWKISSAVQDLSNEDLHVYGNIFGLMVFLEGEGADQLREIGKPANSALLRALDDHEKFAAAHRILCELNEDRFREAGGFWNDSWDPFSAASNDFDPELAEPLKKFWSKALADPMGFGSEDRIVKFNLYEPIEFEVGDLVRCDKSDQEFQLEIDATIYDLDENGSPIVHTYGKTYSFCRLSEELLAGGFQPKTSVGTEINDLVGGNASVETQFTSYGPDSVTVKLNWDVEIYDCPMNFKGEFVAEMQNRETSPDYKVPVRGISGLRYSFRSINSIALK